MSHAADSDIRVCAGSAQLIVKVAMMPLVSASSAFLPMSTVYVPGSTTHLPVVLVSAGASGAQRRRSRMRRGSSAVAMPPAGTDTRAKLLSSLTGRSPWTLSGFFGGFTHAITTSSPAGPAVFLTSTLMVKMASLATDWHGV